ncbi:MAG: RNA polymerase sigma factor [Bacteroidota bacterium]
MNTECNEPLLALIRGCEKEDRASQKMLYQQFYGYAMSVCIRYSKSRDEALEILNDGFLKIFTRIKKYDTERSFKGWVRKIMINTALDHYRKHLKYYETKVSDIQKAPDIAETQAGILSQMAYEDLLALVQLLSPAYRTVFNLHAIDGYTHEEIAEMLEISIGTSKSNLSKARVNLQEMIKKNKPNEYAKQGK